MSKQKTTKKTSGNYLGASVQQSAEVMEFSPTGLNAFFAKLKATQKARPVGRRRGIDGDWGVAGATIAISGAPFKTAPINALTSSSVIAQYLGPLNRVINPSRVQEYTWAIKAGEWWFTPDPIVVTDEGAIINGQHRLMAVEQFLTDDLDDVKKAEKAAAEVQKQLGQMKSAEEKETAKQTIAEAKDRRRKFDTRRYPRFVVVWGVDKKATLLMDEARRTATDRRDIALRYARSAGA